MSRTEHVHRCERCKSEFYCSRLACRRSYDYEHEDCDEQESSEKPDGLYWLDTGWACGGLRVKDRIVVDCAPIFRRKYKGHLIQTIPKAIWICE